MNKDFVTYNTDRIHKLVIDVPGDDNVKSMFDDAKSLPSFVRFEVKEMGPKSRAEGIRFRISVMFKNESAVTWYRLKWAK